MNKTERNCFKKLNLCGRKTFKERLLYWLKGFKNKNFGYSLLLMIDIIFIAISNNYYINYFNYIMFYST